MSRPLQEPFLAQAVAALWRPGRALGAQTVIISSAIFVTQLAKPFCTVFSLFLVLRPPFSLPFTRCRFFLTIAECKVSVARPLQLSGVSCACSVFIGVRGGGIVHGAVRTLALNLNLARELWGSLPLLSLPFPAHFKATWNAMHAVACEESSANCFSVSRCGAALL